MISRLESAGQQHDKIRQCRIAAWHQDLFLSRSSRTLCCCQVRWLHLFHSSALEKMHDCIKSSPASPRI